ncbi:MAG TPA: alpha/beta fold hydrolase, partial [Gemmatimonadales bacterium]|nr:alpha/beta fold hydrolase [Gemmatimonadales bacterium]
MASPEIDLTVYPDECDAYGHLNQASFLALFERARWEVIARGPGMDFFTRLGMWPVVRKSVVEYHAPAFPGDVLRFSQILVHLGRTSFTLRQTARRLRDEALLATAELVFVCVNGQSAPVPVPEALPQVLAERPLPGNLRRVAVNGVNIAVDVRGQGPAILFIHGFPLDHSIWEYPVAKLEGWMRIAPDLRGMGQSDAPDLGYSMSTYAQDLLALLTALGVDKAVVCGHSMGGYIAFEMVRQARERIRALVLVGTRGEADSPEVRKARDTAAAQARDGGAEAIAASMLPRMIAAQSREGKPGLADRVHRIMASTPVAGMLGAIGAMRDRPDSFPLLRGLEGLPVLVLVGDEDEMIPVERSQAMIEVLPQGSLSIVSGAGHIPAI